MSLDIHHRGSWRGLTDLVRPPDGYRLAAAVGTSFGMSFDALVACLLSMLDCDSDGLAEDPLAGLLAATRLSSRVRILVQAGSISGSTNGVPPRLAALLDTMIVSVRPNVGIFHPKLWVLRFANSSGTSPAGDKLRVMVGSRNLTASNSLELGAVVEGVVGNHSTAFGEEVAEALESCFRLAHPNCKEVAALPLLARKSTFETPDEGRVSMRLRWQSAPGRHHFNHLPKSFERVVVVSPFLSADFIGAILVRSETVRIVSTSTAFRKLDDHTFKNLVSRAREQQSPVMYVVGDDFGDEDNGRLDGLHAKLLLSDQGQGKDPQTFVGSANATASGWGINAGANVESMLELHPGLSIDRFLREFLVDKKGAPKPWIEEFIADDRSPFTDEEELQDRLQATARRFAAMRFTIRYDDANRSLAIQLVEAAASLPREPNLADIKLDCIPLGVLEDDPQWQPIAQLQQGPLVFSGVDLSAVSAFIVIRASSSTGHPETRIAFAKLELSPVELERRDEAARQHLISNAPTEDVLAALVFGIACIGRARRGSVDSLGGPRGSSMANALKQVSLERMLQAVAENPDLLREMRILLGSRSDSVFVRFREDLEFAINGSIQGLR